MVNRPSAARVVASVSVVLWIVCCLNWPMAPLLCIIMMMISALLVTHKTPEVVAKAPIPYADYIPEPVEEQELSGPMPATPLRTQSLACASADGPCMEGVILEPGARLVQSSSGIPGELDNENASGRWYAMHKPAANSSSGDAAYFSGRKRMWEVRVQLQLKRTPERPLVFGLELEKYVPLSSAGRALQGWVIKLLQRAVGNDLYHSPGDDPSRTDGPVENPVFMMPLWAFDQIIISDPGAEPDITGSLDGLGLFRNKGRRSFMRAVADLRMSPGKVYTLNFWCISRYLDPANWEMTGVVPGSKISFNTFCGVPPVRVCMYELLDASDPSERRHLQERKRYYWNVAFWSSKCRPPAGRLQELLGAEDARAMVDDEEAATVTGVPAAVCGSSVGARKVGPKARLQQTQTWLSKLASATCHVCGSAA